MNTWLASWFDDLPIPSAEEPFDVDGAIADFHDFLSDNPSPFTDALTALPVEALLALSHPARRKKDRRDALCSILQYAHEITIYLQCLHQSMIFPFFI